MGRRSRNTGPSELGELKSAAAWAGLMLCVTGAAISAVARWTSASPMASARAGHAVVVADRAVYALAGTGAAPRSRVSA